MRPSFAVLFLLLPACGSTWLADADEDQDGYTALQGDCWDAPEGPNGIAGRDIHPDATETWYDGVDQDCAGGSDYDQDGDGFDSSAHPGPDGGDDCFDAAEDGFDDAGGLGPSAVNPGATETWYDGTDADCAGDDDFDQDADGFPRDLECDDTDPLVFPNDSPETWYNGFDENCDGNDGDQDGDGYYVAGYEYTIPAAYEAGDCWDDPADTDGWDPLNGFDPPVATEVHPDADEVWYDGLDEDCAGDGDFDQDGDGHATDAYYDFAGMNGDDCDDTRAATYPGATETWYDGFDADCLGDDDYDQDHDGYSSDDYGGADCDDLTEGVNPDAVEVCGDATDDDCSGSANDPGAFGCTPIYADADGDGYGSDTDSECLCVAEGDYTASTPGDCDDGDAAVSPVETESCSTAADDDCDGSTNSVGADGCTDWYTDVDGDSFGAGTSICQCESAGLFTADNADDCDDAAAGVNPDAAETCDGDDNDCDGATDEGLPLYYADADGDGYGDEADPGDCDSAGGVATNDDCDDATSWTYPGAPEVCDGAENDCDPASVWAESDEDQLVAYITSAGVLSDVSSTFNTGTANPAVSLSSGTYNFCAGTYYAKIAAIDLTVDVVGIYGADRTVIDNNFSTGSVFTATRGTVSVTGLTFTEGKGTTGYGGGVFANYTGSAPAGDSLTLTECVVSGNSGTYGGGIAVYNYARVSLVDTRVEDNAATTGGGIWVAANGRLSGDGADVNTNTATTGTGGGIHVQTVGTVTLVDSEVHENAVTGSGSNGDGGGIFLDDGTLSLTNSSIWGNTAEDDAAGLYIDSGTATCLATTGGGVYQNTAGDHGGGVYLGTAGTGSFTSSGCDFGASGGATDNDATDVTIKTSGSYTEYSNYGDGATFSCYGLTALCAPISSP